VEVVYSSVIGAARLGFRALGLRIRLDGDEHVPVSGPVIIAGNHVSFLDFMLVGLAARRSRRYVRFLTRYDVWHTPVVGAAMSAMGHVPVDRAAPAAAYLRARTLLRRGEAVGVFPEAGVSTSYTVRGLMPGAVALAQETGAPLVPLALWGSQRILTAKQRPDLTRGRPVSLRVGEPLTVRRDADPREQTRLLGERLQGLLDELQARDEHRPEPGEHAPWHPAHLGGHAPDPVTARLNESVPTHAVAPTWASGAPAGKWPMPAPNAADLLQGSATNPRRCGHRPQESQA
jgi:1-acyl-sn-glycerol-3-phosphate acyltransferase